MSRDVKSFPPFDSEKILHLLNEKGQISAKLPHFEVREEQVNMLQNLIEAFNQNGIALIEAGTGTGKSIAYLIPALLSALIWKQKVVISTQTIALQEQLLIKDLPLLMQALDISLKAVLVKGMGNYVCLRKWDEIEIERMCLPKEEAEILFHIEDLSRSQGIGSKGDFPFSAPSHIWEMISADFDTCNGTECPHYQNCYYIQARKNAQDAQVLIVNHHLLLADLVAKKKEEKNGLLPPYSRLLIDEAHHLQEIALDYFASKTSKLELLKILNKISHEKLGANQGKLSLIKEKLLKYYPDDFSAPIAHLNRRLALEAPALCRDVVKEITDVFHLLEQFQGIKERGDENKLRLRPHHYESEEWKNRIAKQLCCLKDLLMGLSTELLQIEYAISEFEDERFIEGIKGPLHDLKSFSNRLREEAEYLEVFANTAPAFESIRWLESSFTKKGLNTTCIDAVIDISKLLCEHLFEPLDTVALMSATLTTKGSFKYIKEQMGLLALKQRPLIEAIYPSPFNFEKQALLIVPQDIAAPNSPDFLEQAFSVIEDAVDASRGNAFILFTSYGMLKICYEKLFDRLKAKKYHPLKQGAESRKTLLEKFCQTDRSILFGTDSFWEGVDVAGEALRLVIIVKLPFKVPTDPLLQAKSEAIEKEGGDPFRELLLPEAAIKLKQGFGRLIRNKKDRGCILCLDSRLITKSYGSYFLKSLPPCPLLKTTRDRLKQEMEDFYKKTYYLTCQ